MTEMSEVSSDLIEVILSFLPIPSLIRASTVCKLWYSIISSPSFSSITLHNHNHNHPPWFFLYGFHNISSKNDQSFAFDPLSNRWLRLPALHHQHSVVTSFIGTNGFSFITSPNFCYAPTLNSLWRPTPPLHFPRTNPLLAVFSDDIHSSPKFIVVGGVKLIGNLVDIEERLDLEIYDPLSNSWQLGPPLPSDFRSANSSLSLSSALFAGRFYVLGISSSFISSFDLRDRLWSPVHTLRPPGVLFSFLIACTQLLVLAGIRNAPLGPSFTLWKLDPKTMELSEMSVMPHTLLYTLFDSDEDDNFASLKCVGLGDFIYVFNEDFHRVYPACLCEIDSKSGSCSWRRVPHLPLPVNKFHKVASFCSTVSLHTILGERRHPPLLQSA